MHLSLLSDGYLSDSIADAWDATDEGEPSFARAHGAGLLRGALVALTLAIPLTLTVVLTPAHGAGQGPREAATHLRVTHGTVR